MAECRDNTRLDGRTDGRACTKIVPPTTSSSYSIPASQLAMTSSGGAAAREAASPFEPFARPHGRPERVPPEHLKLPHARKYAAAAAAAPTNGSPLDWQ